jgi:membrane fusion protein YbhG
MAFPKPIAGPKTVVVAVALALLIGAGALIVSRLHKRAAAEIEVSGRIEGRITTLTAKSFGKVAQIRADEGRTVQEGEILALLDDQTQRARVEAEKQKLNALKEQLRAAEISLTTLDRQTVLRVEQAEAALAEANTRVRRTRASYEQARRDAQRYEELARQKIVAPQKAEDARLQETLTLAALNEATAAERRAQRELQIANTERALVPAKQAERDALLSQIKEADARVAEEQSYLDEFVVRSPISATILTRTIELGERVSAGTPLYTLVNLNALYVKVYIPEPVIGKIALNQPARVQVDAYPGRFFLARVSKVAQQAEFTPKNVETKEERVKLVFAVELSLLSNPGGVLKPGMPADAFIKAAEIPTAGARSPVNRGVQANTGSSQ